MFLIYNIVSDGRTSYHMAQFLTQNHGIIGGVTQIMRRYRFQCYRYYITVNEEKSRAALSLHAQK